MTGVRLGGWSYPVVGEDWNALTERYLGGPEFVRVSGITAIVESIAKSPARVHLRYATSMWALVVTPAPGTPGPVDVVRVDPADGGGVVVEHLPLVGMSDRIERPSADAVALFWRFLKEKYGLEGRAS